LSAHEDFGRVILRVRQVVHDDGVLRVEIASRNTVTTADTRELRHADVVHIVRQRLKIDEYRERSRRFAQLFRGYSQGDSFALLQESLGSNGGLQHVLRMREKAVKHALRA